MTTSNDHHNQETIVTEAINELLETNDTLTRKDIIEKLSDPIVESFKEYKTLDRVKSVWTRALKKAAQQAGITLDPGNRDSWIVVEEKINEEIVTPSSDSEKPAPCSIIKSGSPLRNRVTEQEKEEIEKMFSKLDKTKFWTLQATIDEAARNGVPAVSVEEKMKKFALSCNFHHPSQSFILDLEDEHWDDVFTPAEIEELQDYGGPLLLPVDPIIEQQLAGLSTEMSAKEVYQFAQAIQHDPEHDTQLAWLALSLMSSSLMFIKNVDVDSYLESDKQYKMFGFINDIFVGSAIKVSGKEKCSKASGTARNKKRKLSAVEEIQRKATGRKMDAVYVGGRKELGCMESGGTVDQTKAWSDGRLKMPIVMKDMLLEIVEDAPFLVNKVGIVGYLINGVYIHLLDMDVPKGYVTRIRRTRPIAYPSSSGEYAKRIKPLLNLAAAAKHKMENTLRVYSGTEIPLQTARRTGPILPPCFPYTLPPSASSSSVSAANTATS